MRDKKKEKWSFSFAPIIWCNVVFCSLILLQLCFGVFLFSFNKMQERTDATIFEAEHFVETRIEQSLKLLNSLAAQSRYADPDVPVEEKIVGLNQVNDYFGYMMIRYVDKDMNVHSAAGATSLASRDYMQRLFATGTAQITDSFAAGADGVTLNYTVAVPIFGGDRQVTGCLFCAIYFDEIVTGLQQSSEILGVQTILLGSENQIMSTTDDLLSYGKSYVDELGNYRLRGTSTAQIENAFYSHTKGNFWSFRGFNIYYTAYTYVENTNWNLVSTVGFWETYYTLLPNLLIMLAICAVLLFGLIFLTIYFVKKQLKVVDILVQSVKELEHQIYQNERPNDVNFSDIIHLTSTGLSDGLTGVVTRTVFLNQFKEMLRKGATDKILALCFVDLDNLKKINDSYGHGAGDIVLKNIGYLLREYEKMYNGLIGRYGGDEFILVLPTIDSKEELREVLEELVLKLHSTLRIEGKQINIKCSIGVSVWDGIAGASTLIKEADEALYFVKQNGKGYYKIYQDKP